jgi:hypothetical protein
MNLGETFQWSILPYGMNCRFADCCCRHEGEFSSRKLGTFSDLQDPLYGTSGDIEKIHPGHRPIVHSIIWQMTGNHRRSTLYFSVSFHKTETSANL